MPSRAICTRGSSLGACSVRRVGPVGEQGESEVRIGVRQVVDFEPFEQTRCIAFRTEEHRRHHDERRAIVGACPWRSPSSAESAAARTSSPVVDNADGDVDRRREGRDRRHEHQNTSLTLLPHAARHEQTAASSTQASAIDPKYSQVALASSIPIDRSRDRRLAAELRCEASRPSPIR